MNCSRNSFVTTCLKRRVALKMYALTTPSARASTCGGIVRAFRCAAIPEFCLNIRLCSQAGAVSRTPSARASHWRHCPALNNRIRATFFGCRRNLLPRIVNCFRKTTSSSYPFLSVLPEKLPARRPPPRGRHQAGLREGSTAELYVRGTPTPEPVAADRWGLREVLILF